MRRGYFEGKKEPAEDMSSGRYFQSNSAGAELVQCSANWGVLDGDARWRHLANTTEPSMTEQELVKPGPPCKKAALRENRKLCGSVSCDFSDP